MIEDLFKPEILLILFVIIFFLFGAQRLPGLGKSPGHGIREFRNGIAGARTRPERSRPRPRRRWPAMRRPTPT